MNIQIEHTATGEKRFVHISRSGRRYGGATPAEAERKTLLAALHALKRTIGGDLAIETCARMFGGICSFGDLTVEQMRELKNTFIESLRIGEKLEKEQRIEPMATDKQIKQMVKLGRYSIITATYGTGFFWRKVKEWCPRLRGTHGRIELDDLSNQEAWTVIRRLQKIEARLKQGNRDEQE
jgi:hypothetical protein